MPPQEKQPRVFRKPLNVTTQGLDKTMQNSTSNSPVKRERVFEKEKEKFIHTKKQVTQTNSSPVKSISPTKIAAKHAAGLTS